MADERRARAQARAADGRRARRRRRAVTDRSRSGATPGGPRSRLQAGGAMLAAATLGRQAAGRRPAPVAASDWKRPAGKDVERTADQAIYDGPALPDDITGAELDRAVAAQLKGLPDKLAARIARHLAAAGMLRRRGPRDGLPAHARRPRPRAAPRGRPRGGRRGGVRGRPLRRGARRAAGRQADERRHGLPADHGRLPPRARQPRAGDQAGQEPVGRQLRLRGQGGDDAGRGRRPPRPRPARRRPARPSSSRRSTARAGSPGWSGCATPTPTRSWPPVARRTRWRGSTARTRSTPTSSPTPPPGPRTSSGASTCDL